MASRSAQDHYSDKSEQSQDDRDAAGVPLAEATTVVTDDDDWLSDLDMTPALEEASNEEIMRALDSPDDDTPHHPLPVTPVADWLTDVRELARKHGPFSAAQILQMVRELDTPGDEATR